MNGWLLFLVIVTAYLGFVSILKRRRAPLPGGFEVNGPFIFWRTQFGKRWLQRIAQADKFWNRVADVGIVLTWITGAAIFALLIYQLTLYFTAPQIVAESATPPEFLIGLPGINPLIPVWYGLAALVIALVIHEGSHGVMAYVGRMKVKSLGLLLFVVPVGAFVEPDEEDMEKASTRAKNRVFAAGPSSNLFTALVCGVLLTGLFMSNITIASDEGVGVGNVVDASPADAAGLREGDILLAFRDITLYPMPAEDDEAPPAGDPAAEEPAPPEDEAQDANETVDSEPEHLEEVRIVNATHFSEVLNQTRANENLTLVFLRDGEELAALVTLSDRYDHVAAVAPHLAEDWMRGKGFIGMGTINLQFVDGLTNVLERPFRDGFPGSFSMGGTDTAPGSFIFYISYPFIVFFTGVDVLAPPYRDFLVIDGPMATLGEPLFFGIAALLYWIVWINIMLGTFNALPAGPLDGGQMFRVTLRDRLMRRYRVDESKVQVERQELSGGLQLRGRDADTQQKLDRIQHIVSRATWTLGLFILALILLPLIGPRLLQLMM